jgi:hypothetical protein
MTHRKKRHLSRRRAAAFAAAILATGIIVAYATALARHGRTSADPVTPTSFRSASAPHSPSPGHGSRGTGSPGTGSPAPGSAAASLIPASGAYLGAYVQPALYTSSAEIAAVRSFQRTVGGPINLVHTYHPWDDPFPDAADRHFVHAGKVLLLTWSGTPDTRKIIAGDYDRQIRARAKAVKRLGRPILMEFRHEMDRPNLQWAVHGPRNFIAAWDHIRAIFSRVGATNVGWVWCPTGWGFKDGRAEPFYPGNNEVDWVCADVYSVSTNQPLQVAAQPFLKWARTTHKPVLIGEFGVDGAPVLQANWLLAAGALARMDPQIKGMAYFDANGTDSQGRPFQYWIGGNGTALSVFRQLRRSSTFRPVLGASQ